MLLFLISRDCVRNAGHPPPRGPCAVKGQLRVHKGREHLEARAVSFPSAKSQGRRAAGKTASTARESCAS